VPLPGFRPRRRGVGFVYSHLVHDFLVRRADQVDVVEIEPQTAWTADHPVRGPFHQIAEARQRWLSLPQEKLLHSVGMPLAGLRAPSPGQTEILKSLAEAFGCDYISEHLSVGGTPHDNAGFLLPPRQTRSGIEVAVRNIKTLQEDLGIPVAVETGVSYLPRYQGEIPDGDYVREVAERADCGVLFDLHNAYCNQLNGRQAMAEFAEALPANRVWELHVAGGFEKNGFWLDAHSGEAPKDLVRAAKALARGFPNIAAIIFEIYPSFLTGSDDDVLMRSLDVLKSIWAEVGRSRGDGDLRQLADAIPRQADGATPAARPDDVSQWERSLTEAVRFNMPVMIGEDLSPRPAVALYNELIHSFRASMLIRLMPRTLRIIAEQHGDLEAIIRDFEVERAPLLFALNEVNSFRDWARSKYPGAAYLSSIMDYEIAVVEVSLTGAPVTVAFDGDPQPLFQALADRTPLPAALFGRPWEIEITPEVGNLTEAQPPLPS
jgi:uncharacterized protein (UPF0276 family)